MHTVIETPTFLSDCRKLAIIDAVADDPLAGDVITGTGGARKRRFAGRGKGKSGGYRVISYYAGDDVPVVLLALVDKGERADLSQAGRNEMRKLLGRVLINAQIAAACATDLHDAQASAVLDHSRTLP